MKQWTGKIGIGNMCTTKIELVTRDCSNPNCVQKFRVMEKDKQKYCSQGCLIEIEPKSGKERSQITLGSFKRLKEWSRERKIVDDYAYERQLALAEGKLKNE